MYPKLKRGKAIQICGTGSGVGKSLMVSGLCRIFLQDGYSVTPFKAQNMALNSFVTGEPGEIGRAQAVQAQASRIEPSIDMNPILIKPTSDVGAQIIVRGKPVGNMNVLEYRDYKSKLLKIVRASFERLINSYDVVIIEGAGSPAEINLRPYDIVNMQMAEYARAPVILVGDIDRGGVFAWIIGTLDLLTKKERNMVKGIIINKFRGDKTLLAPGIDFLQRHTKIKVLGIIPYFKEIKIPEEDSVSLEIRTQKTEARTQHAGMIDIAVVKLPHISNFTDFDALETEPDVRVRFIKDEYELDSPDMIILPGTKSTIKDLKFLKDSGLAEKILQIIKAQPTTVLVGICGGYQMLGKKIYDNYCLESHYKKIEALGLLPIKTVLEKDKQLTRVKAIDLISGREVSGYEIHHGRTKKTKDYKPAFKITERNGKKVNEFEGAISPSSQIWGTYIHGVFDEDAFRRDFLNKLRLKKGCSALAQIVNFNLDKELDKLANLLRKNINLHLLYKILKYGL